MIVKNKDQTHSCIGRSFTDNSCDLIKLREWRGHPDSRSLFLRMDPNNQVTSAQKAPRLYSKEKSYALVLQNQPLHSAFRDQSHPNSGDIISLPLYSSIFQSSVACTFGHSPLWSPVLFFRVEISLIWRGLLSAYLSGDTQFFLEFVLTLNKTP